MAKKSRGWMIMSIAGLTTVRELMRDHQQCEGCGSRNKPVYTYLGKDDEPIVCSKACFSLAIVKRFGGVRKPTAEQLAEASGAHSSAKSAKVIPLRRKAG